MKTTALKSLFFLLSFIFSVCMISTDKQAVASDLAEANAMALSTDGPGPLCRGQLYKNCKSQRNETCTFMISPSVSCSFSGFTNKGNLPVNPD
ncbi:MAG: hypothetical protein RBS23_08695 [Mariniphaga sp.]|mgnify:CR=1 FL=1|jgi:hypothetical protein|nr:hypothetical protein [Mariniphaga sp.]